MTGKKATDIRHYDLSWDQITRDRPAGVKSARLVVGDGPNAPAVWRSEFPAGCTVSPHTHDCDYAEFVLEGSQRVGKKWYSAGDIRVVKGGTTYGPLTAGPDGVTILVVMASGLDTARPPLHGAPLTINGME